MLVAARNDKIAVDVLGYKRFPTPFDVAYVKFPVSHEAVYQFALSYCPDYDRTFQRLVSGGYVLKKDCSVII